MNSSKKKSELATILDDLRSEDSKKRLAAVRDIKEVATAIGPARVRSDLIGFLAQFIDDEENIVLELINQLEGFSQLVGGPEHEKALLPLLVSFCKTDQKKVGFRASQLIQKIVQNNKDLALEIIKKLMKSDMNVSKECGIQIITNLYSLLQSSESSVLELYLPLHHSDNPQLRIIACKYLSSILRKVKAKEEATRVLEVIYSDGGQLQKMLGLQALADFYQINNNFSLTKFKQVSMINSWRINIKVCQVSPKISQKMSKSHFKLIFEPMFLKFMYSSEPELRSASCKTMPPVCKSLSEDEQKNKLQPLLKKLATDPVDYVKVEFSKHIVPMCAYVSAEFMAQCILPIILSFMKDANSQIALGIVKHFDYLASKMPKQQLEDKIIKPLLQQLSTQNWRVKCQIIQILKEILVHQTFLSESVLKVFIGLIDDRIDAVRIKAKELLIAVVSKNSKEWCEVHIIPKVFASKENSYIKKQNMLDIIQKTSPFVSEKTLKQTYQLTLMNYLGDKVPNVRLKTAQVIKSNPKLVTPVLEKQLDRLKEDKDSEIRDFSKKLRA